MFAVVWFGGFFQLKKKRQRRCEKTQNTLEIPFRYVINEIRVEEYGGVFTNVEYLYVHAY